MTMTKREIQLRIADAADNLRKLREAVEKRQREAGPQRPEDHDYSAKWLGKPLNWQQGKKVR